MSTTAGPRSVPADWTLVIIPGNIIWMLFGDIFTALYWFLAGCLFRITIIGIPLGRQAFKMASLIASLRGPRGVTPARIGRRIAAPPSDLVAAMRHIAQQEKHLCSERHRATLSAGQRYNAAVE